MLSYMEDCVSEIKLWIHFKLNDDQTKFSVFKSKRNVNMFVGESVHVGCTTIKISPKVKNLGSYI